MAKRCVASFELILVHQSPLQETLMGVRWGSLGDCVALWFCCWLSKLNTEHRLQPNLKLLHLDTSHPLLPLLANVISRQARACKEKPGEAAVDGDAFV